MNTKSIVGFIALLGLAISSAGKVDYAGHKVIRVALENQEQVDFLRDWETAGGIDVMAIAWGPNKSKYADIRVSPNTHYHVAETLKNKKMNYEIHIQDLGYLEEIEQKSIALRRAIHNGKTFDFANYHPYDEILAYLSELNSTNPLASTSVAGTTNEERDIIQISISTDPSAGKPVIFFDCNIHAREWITSATCLWIIDQLTTGYGVDAEITALIDQYDWKFVPVSNPDGFVFTWTDDRLWRKNRIVNNGSACRGVDLNRNFMVGFGGEGSSNLPCSETYHGVAAFSEKESSTLRDLIAADRGRVKVGISVHSYSQYWLSAYGYTNDLPAEYDEMFRVMTVGVEAITATYGTQYTYGTFAEVLYIGAGASTDFYYANEGVVHSYTVELRDTGAYGFQLPAEQIIPTATETWNGLKAFINAL